MKDNTWLWIALGGAAAFYFYKRNETQRDNDKRQLLARARQLLIDAGLDAEGLTLERDYDRQVQRSDASIDRLRDEFPGIVDAEQREPTAIDDDLELEDEETELVEDELGHGALSFDEEDHQWEH